MKGVIQSYWWEYEGRYTILELGILREEYNLRARNMNGEIPSYWWEYKREEYNITDGNMKGGIQSYN